MAPAYKLTYFNSRGLSEPIRFILSYAGQEFEDVRVEQAQWPAMKSNTPFGKIPMLEFDGKTLHQSTAISRHLARKFDLVGDGEWDALQADIVVDTLGDLKTQAIEYIRLAMQSGEMVEKLKAEKKDVLVKETLPFYLTKFEEIVKNNKGYFVNGKLTWADLTWTCFYETLASMLGKDFLRDYPNLNSVNEKVLALPAIKVWIAKRPITPR